MRLRVNYSGYDYGRSSVNSPRGRGKNFRRMVGSGVLSIRDVKLRNLGIGESKCSGMR